MKIMLERCMRSKFFIPLKWAPAQLCRIAEQEQVGEESQRVQSEEGGGGVENEQLGPPFWHESYHGD